MYALSFEKTDIFAIKCSKLPYNQNQNNYTCGAPICASGTVPHILQWLLLAS